MKTTFFHCFFPELYLHLLCKHLLDFMHLSSSVSHHNFLHNLASLDKVLIENATPCHSATDGETESKSGGVLDSRPTGLNGKKLGSLHLLLLTWEVHVNGK